MQSGLGNVSRARSVAVSRTRDKDREERQESIEGKPHVVYGSVDVAGVGEGTVTIPFPVKFTERPVFLFGGELVQGERLEGFMPTVNAVVISWGEDVMPQSTPVDRHVLTTGADVGIVTTGTTDQKFVLHYAFEGIALVNPVSPHHDGMGEI